MIWALVLAAGESKRMGKPKLLLPFREKTVIESVVESVLESEAAHTLVVLGSGWKRIKEKISHYPIKTAVNKNFKQGMLSSVQFGFSSIPENTEAVVVLLGDQPAIPPAVINTLIHAYHSSGKGIIIPVYKNERGHPVLIDFKYRKKLKSLHPDVGLRGLVYNHPRDTLEVAVDTPIILRDIDTLKDYKKALKGKIY
ncbi:MAG: NTP transferase domain-containing protein [Candidatus Aminicenantales bacterium]